MESEEEGTEEVGERHRKKKKHFPSSFDVTKVIRDERSTLLTFPRLQRSEQKVK